MAVSKKKFKRETSRSKSNPRRMHSNYCETCKKQRCQGCPSIVTTSSVTDRNNKSKNTLQKLLTAIQQFHNNLCSLPLDILINSTHPEVWVQEQKQTCQQLEDKLAIMQKKEMEAGSKANLEYYRAKMDSVRMVLNNIIENMKTLRGIYETQLLSEYTSARSSNNRTVQFPNSNSSQTSKRRSAPTSQQQLSPETQFNPQQITLTHFSPHPEQNNMQTMHRYKREYSQYEIGEKSFRDQRSYQSIDGEIKVNSINKNNKLDVYAQALERYQRNIENLKNSHKNEQKENKMKNSNHQTVKNMGKQMSRSRVDALLTTENQFNLQTCMSEQQETFQKPIKEEEESQISNQSNIQSPNVKTKRIDSSSLHPHSHPHIKLTQAKKTHSQFQNLLEMMKSMAPKYHSIETNESESLVDLHKLKPLLEEIKELKDELMDKNKQIQRLLVSKEQLESIIELLQNQLKSETRNESFRNQRITNLEELIEKYEKQLKAEKDVQAELRQATKSQASCILNLQKQRQELQKRLQMEAEEGFLMKQEIRELREEYGSQIQRARKQQKIAKQKMDIYKQKYYQLIQEKEIHKINSKQTYGGKVGKIREIHQILEEHRRNLNTEDVDVSVGGHQELSFPSNQFSCI